MKTTRIPILVLLAVGACSGPGPEGSSAAEAVPILEEQTAAEEITTASLETQEADVLEEDLEAAEKPEESSEPERSRSQVSSESSTASRGQEPESRGAGTEGEPPVARFDEKAWAGLLERFAVAGGLRYAGLKESSAALGALADGLDAVRPTALPRQEALAFWINAYNVLVAREVVRRYPEIESVIKEEGFFDRQTHAIAGEELTLNQIERRALDLGEPRVHFAVVCASVGCPDLRGEPFSGDRLETQLREQTAAFLAEPSKGLRLDRDGRILYLSSIFDWYGGDFDGDVVGWILPLLPRELAGEIQTLEPKVQFIEYDWNLNDRP